MDTLVFGDFTVKELLIAAVVIVVFISLIKKIFKKEKTDVHVQQVECLCGWKGHVSVHAGRCPKCNAPIGSQRSKGC